MNKIVMARDLQPGDKLLFTLETVVRTFTDRLTEKNKISITLERSDRTRTTSYKSNRKIKVLA